MGKLSAPPARLGAMPSRLRGAAVGNDGNTRRSSGPYNTGAWQKFRLEIMFRDAECFEARPDLVPLQWPSFKLSAPFKGHHWLWPVCQKTGVLLIGGRDASNSAVVDHIVPHRGDMKLFWARDNVQTMSKAYHDKVKQSMESSGRY